MSYPDPRYLGDKGEISAVYRPAGQEPELTIGSGTALRYLATGASTNRQFGLYRWEMRPHASGPSAHFHKTISESFFILSGTVRLFNGERWIDVDLAVLQDQLAERLRDAGCRPSTGTDKLRFVNPPGLYNPAPNGYSHLAVFPADWRIILPAGQGGETEDQVLSDDFATQFRQALANTETVLEAAGVKMSDVAKINLLIVDHNKEKFRVMTEEVDRVWGDRKPEMTLIPVPALALEGMLVEIDVIAVVPA